ncbi:hypothetical protein EVJ58_g226 [Rhodofomes roseus]|uniref:Survival protein SurE-like phosphatase/nucleotidase domain-containing protein n=1 Tax=Rhodofomes roseus TaxID=34475 RepID=A0A4Y9Z5N3_9APHY|nr:hypothetical protein EVJ58_g226 [Rhodofomes roseus]
MTSRNDDGPPGPESPYVYGLYQHLTKDLGWDVKVVLPSSQKSWIGKAYHIHEVINGRFYYPRGPDGEGELSEQSRPLREGETAEWILLDGTPATCSNIGLNNLYHGEIDLVISGPNFGRNSSELHAPAHVLATKILAYLLANWGADTDGGLRGGEVDLYNVNVPMVTDLLSDAGLPICWTTIWRNAYGRLFKAHRDGRAAEEAAEVVSGAGPDSQAEGKKARGAGWRGGGKARGGGEAVVQLSTLPVGSDGWAIRKGWASVTPIRASFAEPTSEPVTDIEEKIWKMKL